MGSGFGSWRKGNAFFTVKYIFIVFNVLVWVSKIVDYLYVVSHDISNHIFSVFFCVCFFFFLKEMPL